MTLDAFTVAFGVAGAALGFVADVIAHRWPAHEEGHTARPRFDWRTALVVVVGAFAFGVLGGRLGHDTNALLVYVPVFAALLVLLATDLDQRLLPDLVTLPLIAFAAIVLLLDLSPALSGKNLGLVSGLAAAVIFPVLFLVTGRVFGGELGFGDVKLSVSLGLLFGLSAYFYGLLLASVGFALVLVVLMAARRLNLKSAVPYGPVLIFAAFLAALSG